ncbi:hypothetical protein H4S04_001007 [Coemansia sp. S16]|nr:hypothetical protein H4S03_001628 [Coemansia sp. S3946]KAJ2052942.1 hypothetical protein H4S04_001007 [Coemansia sp. S16]KAJ2074476.1 hypothetical protein GGH13_001298 [Coemansia sp. S155-1]
MNLHTKKLRLKLSEYYIYNGLALEALLREPYVDFTSPKACSLDLKLDLSRGSDHSAEDIIISSDAEAHIRAFVRHIRQKVPMLQKAYIGSTSDTAIRTHLPSQQFDTLVAQICQSIPDIELRFPSRPIRMDSSLSAIRRLVNDNREGGSIESMVQLVRHNALTLQHLDLNLLEGDAITGLIQNADGSYVQYPDLHTLRFRTTRDRDLSRQPVFPGAVPFPCLRNLNFIFTSPIGDDTPFRGNSATLGSLGLYLTQNMIAMLRRNKVFTPTSHPRLQYVRLEWTTNPAEHRSASEFEYMKFGLSIGPNALVRQFCMTLLHPGLGSVLTAIGKHKCIQVLELAHTSMHIMDIIALLKALPLLSHLHSKALLTDPLPNDIPEHEIPAYMIANYSPMGRWFRCWRISNSPNFNYQIIVRWALLLALICPNLDYVAVLAEYRELFMAHMQKMIASSGYRQHVTRLRRLLFGGWSDHIPSVEIAQAKMEATTAAVAN